MKPAGMDADLQKQLAELEKTMGGKIALADVGDVVSQLHASMKGDISSVDFQVHKELESLARYIAAAKAEIAELSPHEIQDKYIPSATDELDAIVAATESATNEILDACEKIETQAGTLEPDQGGPFLDATTRIYEACNFQDITGQRITKVVKALKHIETKVADLARAVGADVDRPAADGTPPQFHDEREDSHLLHGPQLSGQAKTQDEIDALFASFD